MGERGKGVCLSEWVFTASAPALQRSKDSNGHAWKYTKDLGMLA